MRALLVCLLVVEVSASASPPKVPPPPPGKAKVTVLSTMLAGNPQSGVGEWGFAALVEVDGRRFLVDTGARPDTVLHNAEELKIDLSTVTDVVLTHHHDDHIGGLLALRRTLMKRNPQALIHAHHAPGFFAVRLRETGDNQGLAPLRKAYEATGASFVEHAGPVELAPGVWFTGPVARKHPEHHWSKDFGIKGAKGPIEDTIPEDSSIVIDTPEGLIVITGCGHAGIANIVDAARGFRNHAKVVAIVGGLHLLDADETSLAWTAGKLRDAGVQTLLGAHCTGIEAVFRLRALLGLSRKTAVVAAVGSSYTHGAGVGTIDPLALAK